MVVGRLRPPEPSCDYNWVNSKDSASPAEIAFVNKFGVRLKLGEEVGECCCVPSSQHEGLFLGFILQSNVFGLQNGRRAPPHDVAEDVLPLLHGQRQ